MLNVAPKAVADCKEQELAKPTGLSEWLILLWATFETIPTKSPGLEAYLTIFCWHLAGTYLLQLRQFDWLKLTQESQEGDCTCILAKVSQIPRLAFDSMHSTR